MLTWFVLLIFGLAFLLAMLIVVPIGFVALAASPDVRRIMRTGLTAFAPLMLIGLGLLYVLGTSKVVQHPPVAEVLQMHSPPPPPVVVVPEGMSVSLVETDAEATTPPANASVSLDPQAPVSITVYVGESTPGQIASEVPAWVTAAPEIDPQTDTERFTLQSRRYSSVEEAEAELLQSLRGSLGRYLQRGGVSLDPKLLTLSDIQRAHIRLSRVVEQFDLALKSTTEPMYRVTWQVSLRPVVRESLGAEYQLAARGARLLELGIGAGMLTLLFGTWAAYFRIDDNTQGRYRGRLKLAAIGATLVPLAALFVA